MKEKALKVYNRMRAENQDIDISWRDIDAIELSLGLDLVGTNALVLDIGTHLGGSSCFMAEYLDAPWVFTVDKEIYPQNVRIFLHKRVGQILGISEDIAEKWFLPVDVIFIDAGHLYHEVITDIEKWSKHLKVGGILAGHDYSLKAESCQVKEAVDLLLKEPEWEKISCTDVWVFRKK
jgi:predicted O-methyltransferase YrrM